MRRTLRTVATIALTVVVVAGCGGSSTFPTGKWTATNDARNEAVTEFGPDGNWLLTALGSLIAYGTYSTDGTTTTFLTDSACKDSGAEEGTYTWTHENQQLTFKKQTDECADRIGALDGQAWTPVE